MAREIVEVRHQVAIGKDTEEDAAVVGDDRDVQAERVIDGDKRPHIDQLGASGVEGNLRTGDVRHHQVDHRLRRPAHLCGHQVAGEVLQRRGRPGRELRERLRGDRLT